VCVSVVCVFVYVFDKNCDPPQTVEPIRMPFGVWTCGNYVLTGDMDSPVGSGTFGEHTLACLGLSAVDMLNVMHQRPAEMRPLAIVNVATYLLLLLLLLLVLVICSVW